jgi:hypothetical protein
MTVAVLTDIHANLAALDAVLDALGPVDAIWVLGDIVGYGPDPDAVVARLRERGAVAVRGNHDAAVTGLIGTDEFNSIAAAAARWTAGTISAETKAWLMALPERLEIADFTLVHGSPRDPVWEYVTDSRIAAASLGACATPHAIVGHTHVPRIFRTEADGMTMTVPTDGTELLLDERRTLLNPGGVGQPRDSDPRSCAMLLDPVAGRATWRRIAYPVAVTQARMRAAGLPDPLIDRLAVGW